LTGNYLLIATLLLQAAVAMALQPSNLENSVSGTTTVGGSTVSDTIPPVAPPGRGLSNENDNITIIDTFSQPGVSTLPVESAADNVLATQIQNELIRAIPAYTASGRQINSQGGHVTIQGSVRSRAKSREIGKGIKGSPGVKSVRNNLSVEEAGSGR